VGLIAREIERAGVPTLAMTSAWDVTEAVAAPRSAYVHHPLGHQTGKPGDVPGQIAIVREALAAAERMRTPGAIVALPFLDRRTLAAVYRRAALVLQPSEREGFGLPVIEALARGVPTVAADATSIPEVTGDAALLVDPRDEEAIGAALARVIDDPTLAEDLRGRGTERASAFSWPETARATLRVYRHVAGAR